MIFVSGIMLTQIVQWQSLSNISIGRNTYAQTEGFEMNLYLISQTQNENYDTFDALIVCAENEEDARNITPDADNYFSSKHSNWCDSPDEVTVEYLGIASSKITKEIILGSFNAG